jgi:5'-3' exonuclease
LLARPVPTATPEPAKSKAAAEPAAVLPKVEVKKGRITKLDQQLAQQDEEIAREKKNTKISDVDKALNDSKIAKPLAIFGGESSQFRQHVASERVSLMEDEKDLIEAIAHAKTKAEKAELQKQLDALRAERRELEKALR